jgi:pimeloyl-ACP methyl ester carboxylesterase
MNCFYPPLSRPWVAFVMSGIAALIQATTFGASDPTPQGSPVAAATPPLLDANTYDRFLGPYQLSSGDLIVIARSSRALYYYDPRTRRVRAMERAQESSPEKETWMAGPSLLAYSPVESRITFYKNKAGDVSSLAFADGAAPAQIAKRADFYREERVKFPTRGATLAGTLLLPNGRGPHPAVVCVHGSGRQTRNGNAAGMRLVADHFARHGVAVLIYDKRGAGESSGDWSTEAFEDLAGDVTAAVDTLKRRKEIDATKIGLWGISQAGWIMPMAAARSKDIAFIICVSGAGCGSTVAQQVLYSTEVEMRAKQISPDDIKQVLDANSVFFEHLRAGAASDGSRLDAMVRRLQENTKIKDWLPPLSSEIDWVKRDKWYFLYPIDFDASPFWKQFSRPVLGIFAELDALTQTQRVVSAFATTLGARSNTDFTVTVFPRACHDMLEGQKVDDSALGELKTFAPGYFEVMTDWLSKKVSLKH